jgi:hypothetical protein
MADGLMNNPYLGLLNMGLSPEQAQAQIDEQRALQFANLNPQQRIASGIYKGVTGIGRALGAKDPMLEQASQMRALAQQFDTTTAEGLMQYAQALQRSGNMQAAQAAAMQARQVMEKEAAIGAQQALTQQRQRERAAADPIEKFIQANADKFTPASLEKYRETRKESDLVRFTGPEKEQLSTYGKILKDSGLEPGTPEFQNRMAEYAKVELAAASKRGTTSVQVGLDMKSPKDVADFRGKVLGTVSKQRTAFEAADTAVTLADQAINTGNFAAAEGVASMLAKASGDTQLSNKDIQKYRTDPSFVGTVADVTARLIKGTPTKDTLTQLKKYAEVLRKKQEDSIKLELDVQRKLAKSAGLKDEDINTAFSGILGKQKQTITLSSGAVVEVED